LLSVVASGIGCSHPGLDILVYGGIGFEELAGIIAFLVDLLVLDA